MYLHLTPTLFLVSFSLLPLLSASHDLTRLIALSYAAPSPDSVARAEAGTLPGEPGVGGGESPVPNPKPVFPGRRLVASSPSGSFLGVRMSKEGGDVFGFLGIPFARPPTGELRWKKPMPYPSIPQDEVVKTTKFKPACPQEEPTILISGPMSEDCLYLNVFCPPALLEVEEDKLKSVMVWIHGGALIIGDAASYVPSKLVNQGDVIVVTIQYRLGALGFLATGDGTLLGNYGLWDQNLALKWVKDNIRSFGGHPDKITIFGESAGAWSVGLHALSPHSKGLFNRMILQSGSPTIATQYVKDARTTFNDLAVSLNCTSEIDVMVVECLRAHPAQLIANDKSGAITSVQSAFGAQVDGDFIPDEPMKLVRELEYLMSLGLDQVDVLAGVNNNEGAVTIIYVINEFGYEYVQSPAVFQGLLQTYVGFYTGSDQVNNMKLVEDVVGFFYGGAETFKTTPTPAPISLMTLANLTTDAVYIAPTVQFVRALNTLPYSAKRYLYLLDYDFEFNRNSSMPGSHHADDLPLLFDVGPLVKTPFFRNKRNAYNKPDVKALSDIFVGAISSFAKTGMPKIEVALPGLNMTVNLREWPEFTMEKEVYLSLQQIPQVKEDLIADRIAVWLEVLPRILNLGASN